MEQVENTAERNARELERLRRRINELESANAELSAAAEALRDAQARLRSVAATEGYAIVLVNHLDQIIFWNEGAVHIFGYRQEDVLGKPMTMIIPDLHTDDPGTTLELKGLRRNGDRFPLECCVSCAQSGEDRVVTAIIRDISYRKRALKILEVKTVEARQRTEDLESLIQTVAHDLKSPVITIGGLVRRLKKNTTVLPSDSVRDEILNQLTCSAQSIERFLKDLLDALSVTHTNDEWASVHMGEAVFEVVRQHEQETKDQGITVEVEIEDAVPAVAGDKHRLTQVLDNLIVNAIHHMGRGEHPRVCIQVNATEGYVLTSVSDNGVGIPQEYHEKIFERFFRAPNSTRSGSGTGLGLFIAKKIVESHKGQIWVESEEGKGATFKFTVPKFVSLGDVDYEI